MGASGASGGLLSRIAGGCKPTRSRSAAAIPPRALRSMLSAISMMKPAKASFSGRGFIQWASRTPQVVVTSVTPITIRKAGRLTSPTVKGGRSGAPQP